MPFYNLIKLAFKKARSFSDLSWPAYPIRVLFRRNRQAYFLGHRENEINSIILYFNYILKCFPINLRAHRFLLVEKPMVMSIIVNRMLLNQYYSLSSGPVMKCTLKMIYIMNANFSYLCFKMINKNLKLEEYII